MEIWTFFLDMNNEAESSQEPYISVKLLGLLYKEKQGSNPLPHFL